MSTPQAIMPAPPLRPAPARRWPLFVGVAMLVVLVLSVFGFLVFTQFKRQLPEQIFAKLAASAHVNLRATHTQSADNSTPVANIFAITFTPEVSALKVVSNTDQTATDAATLATFVDANDINNIVFYAREVDEDALITRAPDISTVLTHILPDQWWQLDLEPSPLRTTMEQATLAHPLTCWRDVLAASQAHPELFAVHPFLRLEHATDAPISAPSGQLVYKLDFNIDAFAAYLQILPSDVAVNCKSDIWTAFVQPETTIYVSVDFWHQRLQRFYFTHTTDTVSELTDVNVDYSPISIDVPTATPLSTVLMRTTALDPEGNSVEVNTLAHAADYFANTTAAERNRDRIFDLETVADALDACHTDGGYYGDTSTLSQVLDRDTGGPFAAASNPCLSHDVAPALVAYPYAYTLYPDRGAYVMCAALERTDDWFALGNSHKLLRRLEDIDTARACQANDKTCYYCVARTD